MCSGAVLSSANLASVIRTTVYRYTLPEFLESRGLRHRFVQRRDVRDSVFAFPCSDSLSNPSERVVTAAQRMCHNDSWNKKPDSVSVSSHAAQ